MPIYNPSQYECDNIEIGDLVYVKKASLLKKLLRKLYPQKFKKVKVRKNWDSDIYTAEYQEDCIIMHDFEMKCVKTYDNIVPCIVSGTLGSIFKNFFKFKSVIVGLYNIQLIHQSGKIYTIPTYFIENAINSNRIEMEKSEDRAKVKELLKYNKYTPTMFQEKVFMNEINEWKPYYCQLCGKPMVLKFHDDNIDVNSNCVCGFSKQEQKNISYEEFTIWYANQVTNDNIRDKFDSFWFYKGESSD